MNLSPLPIQKFFDNNGNPLNGGKLFTYVAGTTNKVATYTDSGGGTSNANPIILDFRGECNLWIDPQRSYKFVLAPSTDTDPPTNPIWTVDNITAAPQPFDNTAVDTGAANNITLSIPQITSPVAFTRIIFKALNTNTGATTIQINGGVAQALRWQNGNALGGQEIVANGIYEAIYDGSVWQLQGPTLVAPFDPRVSSTIPTNAWTTQRITAWGYESMLNSSSGQLNVAFGYRTQRNSVTGGGGLNNAQGNTAIGAEAMSVGTCSGDFNVAVGYLSMANHDTAYCCTAVGLRTLTAMQTGQYNTALGCDALLNADAVNQNTAVGAKSMLDLTAGENNVGVGVSTWENLTTGNWNTAVGTLAGLTTTIGSENVAIGGHAMELNVTASFNTFVGYFAGRSCLAASNTGVGHECMAQVTTGAENAALGAGALDSLTTGGSNVAIGRSALAGMATGSNSTAVGKDSLFSATAGDNTAFGYFSGRATTSGTNNTFLGRNAGLVNTTGSGNVAVGDNALSAAITANDNVGVGHQALTNATGGSNTALGYRAGSQELAGTTNTFIGYDAGVTQSAGFINTANLGYQASGTGNNQVTLGNALITTLRCAVTTITAISDQRFKKNIRPLDIPDAFLDEIEIVIFEWIAEGMPQGPQVGVLAQQLDELQERYSVQWLGLVDKSNPDRWEATPGKLLFLLIPSHQRLRKRVAALEAA